MGQLENEIKNLARENGADLVGIAARERLTDSPPSADPGYLLAATRSIISFAIALDKKAAEDFLSKKDIISHCLNRKKVVQLLYSISDKLATFLKSRGFEAKGVDINNDYRPEEGAKDVTEMTEFIPDFSHRYGAVAAGIGRLGWSGNLLTAEYGGLVELGSVLTSAELESDPILETNPCDQCKICTAACPVEMMSNKKSQIVRVAGIEEVIAQKKPNTCCWIGCSGYHGLGPNKKWSNWSPYRLGRPLPQEKQKLDELNIRLQKADPQMQLDENNFTNHRKMYFDTDWFNLAVCGNCRLICSPRREERGKKLRSLLNSGIATLSLDGRYSTTAEETVEIDTPYIVKVALKKEEYEKLMSEGSQAQAIKGFSPLDTEVLAFLRKLSRKMG